MNKFQLSQLLDRYLKGQCTPEEIAVINQWYEDYQNNPDFIDSLEEQQQVLLKDKMLNSIFIKTHNHFPPSTTKIAKSNDIAFFQTRWFRAAAVILIFIGAKFVILDPIAQQEVSVQTPLNSEVYNRSKHIIKQVLEDGTIVWLKPNSKLIFPKKFASKARSVSMVGDCFFEVTKNPNRPFIIKSTHLVTKVWGTSFSILDNQEAKEAFVKVLTGKVSVSKKGSEGDKSGAELSAQEIMLKPDQKALFTKANNSLIAENRPDMTDMGIWKQVNLSFDNDKLSEIVKELDRKFNVDIKIEDSTLSEKQMTADLDGLNLAEVLEVLKASMKLNYEINGKMISLNRTK
ncbi:FecR family protein [Pedobacter sp. UBA5917]|jgi:ferric-dicitrate binding protein FerR (iron transport regulator)|uniref:FecR family protein n=1 Tax=Pedobacter sp. UBA5917 TaxID=1947061 RepID=UPI0025DACFEE|nr:FecR domain-containing protein [Pedobacter sp. UBA5917]